MLFRSGRQSLFMGQGLSIGNAKIYIDNNVGTHHDSSSNNNNNNNNSGSPTPSEKKPLGVSQQNDVTVIPLSSFKNKLRVYQHFDTSEVLLLLDCDIHDLPGFKKSETDEWYEVSLCHQQEKYFESFASLSSVSNEDWFHETGAPSGDPSRSNVGGGSVIIPEKKFLKSPKWNQVKRYSAPSSKDKNTLDITPLPSFHLPLDGMKSSSTVLLADREKVESIPPIQNIGSLQPHDMLASPTHSLSTLLTPYANDSEPSHTDEICPFCRENLNEEDGSKHVCNCINSHNIQERFQESDKLLQEVETPSLPFS